MEGILLPALEEHPSPKKHNLDVALTSVFTVSWFLSILVDMIDCTHTVTSGSFPTSKKAFISSVYILPFS